MQHPRALHPFQGGGGGGDLAFVQRVERAVLSIARSDATLLSFEGCSRRCVYVSRRSYVQAAVGTRLRLSQYPASAVVGVSSTSYMSVVTDPLDEQVNF